MSDQHGNLHENIERLWRLLRDAGAGLTEDAMHVQTEDGDRFVLRTVDRRSTDDRLVLAVIRDYCREVGLEVSELKRRNDYYTFVVRSA